MVIVSLIQIEEPEKEKPQRVVMVLPKNAPAEAAVGQKQTDDGGAQKGEQGKADLAPKVEVKKETAADVLKKSNLGNVLSSLTSKTTETAPVAAGTKTGAAASFEQTGTGGFSTKGLKTGGGGKSVGIGRSVGEGVGGFEGTGHLGLSGNTVGAQGTGHGGPETKVAGGLDSDVIESVIKRRLDRVRLCYERQLNFNPQLSGKITVHFVIDGAGQVLSSRAVEDTMKNDAVKSCILAEVKTWTFPKPEGGTLVNVDYPFVFESSARGE